MATFCNCIYYNSVFLLILANITCSKEIHQCFKLSATSTCKKLDPKGNCMSRKGGSHTMHYDKIPTEVVIKLECPEGHEYQINDVTYSLPAKQINFCHRTCTGTSCDCCKRADSVSFCESQLDKTKLDGMVQHCTNLTIGRCNVTLPRMTFDKGKCPELNYQCRDGSDEVCHSRWVTINYSCKIRGTRLILVIVGSIIGGIIGLLFIIYIIRNCLSNDELDDSISMISIHVPPTAQTVDPTQTIHHPPPKIEVPTQVKEPNDMRWDTIDRDPIHHHDSPVDISAEQNGIIPDPTTLKMRY